MSQTRPSKTLVLKYSATWTNSQNGSLTGKRCACFFTVALANKPVGILRYQLEGAQLQAFGAGFSFLEAEGFENTPSLTRFGLHRKWGDIEGFFSMLATGFEAQSTGCDIHTFS